MSEIVVATTPWRRRLRGFPWPEVALLILYGALIALGSAFHEPWRDEADPWLVSRDASLQEILRLMPYTGTPALWYVLQAAIAKLGSPYWGQSALHGTIAFAAAVVWMLRAPFPLRRRALVLFGYYLLYEYSVIARSYSLTILFLFLIADQFRERGRRWFVLGVLIALLANSNAHGYFFALATTAVLLLEWLVETLPVSPLRWANPAPSLAWLPAVVGIALATVQLWPPADGQSASFIQFFRPENLLLAIDHAFLPTAKFASFPEWGAGAALGGGILALHYAGLYRQPRALLLTMGCHLGLAYILAFKYLGGVRHVGLLLFSLLYGLWIGEREEGAANGREDCARDLRVAENSVAPLESSGAVVRWGARSMNLLPWISEILLDAALLYSCWTGSMAVLAEIRGTFSEARQVATYLQSSGLQDHLLVAHQPPHASSILPYLPAARFWYPATGNVGTFMYWDRTFIHKFAAPQEAVLDEAFLALKERNAPRKSVVFVLSQPVPNPGRHGLELRFATDGNLFMQRAADERYWVYETRNVP